ncbi:putative serine palmitoyltransferase [Trypanosoma conorhini]|uniref:serine C-palmitoyltransferase n=1 Tax=Trypanosoma conorhini TaxID=83891 RepID=A0A422PHY0_9TRYP|nr:putative serine palmitoyltransferase [Trypanosoma conorhini]RNF17332.1 putative serine palmitoyltransferase [Trypanosoma conorhini]
MPSYVTSESHLEPKGGLELLDAKAAVQLGSPVETCNKQGAVLPDLSLSEAEDVRQREKAVTATQGTQPPQQEENHDKEEEECSLLARISLFVSFGLLGLFSIFYELYYRLFQKEKGREGYAPLMKSFDGYWQRHFYRRLRDCFNYPIDSRPSRVIGVMERVSHDGNQTFSLTGNILPCVNLSSYNYLGFASDVPGITRQVLDSIDRYGIASCSSPQVAGQHTPIATLERAFADFLGKEDAIVCGMGFGTNFRGLPALFGRDSLVLSDSLNHSSLVNGIRMSGARLKVFKHNQFRQLETLLREAVVLGRNPNGEYVPWTRIIIIVEGIYSMEGEIVDLPRVVALKKKYGALLFVDEAHSIGAIGRTGRGVTEHYGVDTKDVDILMGTFTKSFGSIGGYLAGEQKVIDYLRTHSSIALHCDTLAPPCAQQVLAALDVIVGRDGTDIGRKRIHQLKENSQFLRQGLIAQGFTVLGNDASPVVPVMLYHTGKLSVMARECLRRGLAIVIVGYPATPLLGGRVRFCVSAAHTREDLQLTLDVMGELAKVVHIQYQTPQKLPPR